MCSEPHTPYIINVIYDPYILKSKIKCMDNISPETGILLLKQLMPFINNCIVDLQIMNITSWALYLTHTQKKGYKINVRDISFLTNVEYISILTPQESPILDLSGLKESSAEGTNIIIYNVQYKFK